MFFRRGNEWLINAVVLGVGMMAEAAATFLRYRQSEQDRDDAWDAFWTPEVEEMEVTDAGFRVKKAERVVLQVGEPPPDVDEDDEDDVEEEDDVSDSD